MAVIVPAAERPDLYRRAEEELAGVWPEYNHHGDVIEPLWPRLAGEFAEFQLVLHDPDADEVVATANAVPCRWDGTAAGLPEGIDAVMERGFAGGPADTLSGLAVAVAESRRGAGVSGRMLAALGRVAAAHGLRRLIIPVRPVWKERYPLVPIERYAAWSRPDGLPFDPWLRVHVRAGARILAPAPHSLRITAPVADWEGWVGMTFPDDGDYVFPRGLALLTVDHGADRGRYWEPNVWVSHPVPEAG